VGFVAEIAFRGIEVVPQLVEMRRHACPGRGSDGSLSNGRSFSFFYLMIGRAHRGRRFPEGCCVNFFRGFFRRTGRSLLGVCPDHNLVVG